jgi:hypothetical protein
MFAPITDGSASGSVRQASTARAKSAPPSQFDRLGRRNSNLTRQDPASTRSCHQPDQWIANVLLNLDSAAHVAESNLAVNVF